MIFAILVVWREQKHHTSDSNFCITNIKSVKPVPDSEDYPVPQAKKQAIVSNADELSKANVKKKKND